MTVATHSEGFLGQLLAAPVPKGAGRLAAVRAHALERANALRLPTTRDEAWRFTDLGALARLSVQPAGTAGPLGDVAPWRLAEACASLVFVDGVHVPALSDPGRAVPGVRVRTLRDASTGADADVVETHFARHAGFDQRVFCALNTAHARDAAVIVLEAGAIAEGPIHVLHVATQREAAQAVYPRTLVVAGRDSRCTLVEEYVGAGDGAYFCDAVCEIALDPGASLDHVRLQRESPQAFHISTCAVRQERDSRYRSSHLAFGARLSRCDLDVLQAGEGAHTVIDGLALIGGRQLADMHSFVDHAKPHGSLRQLHKCVVSAAAHGVFNGRILVREGAQQTDAQQASRSLLLSGRAKVDAKPQLEIFADDVKCAHGAAIGQLDPEELFYLRSRGLDETAARALLTYAFAAEIVERLPLPSLAAALQKTVLARTE